MADTSTPSPAAVRRRAKGAIAPQPSTPAVQASKGLQSATSVNAANPNPVTAAASATPLLPSAAVWQNPYPTTYVPVPIASPPANPDLTPQDIAGQVAEYADWDKYISGIGLTAANLSAATTARVRDIQDSLSRSLEANNWDTAARGLAQSSIRQANAAQAASSAATQQGDAAMQLGNQEGFFAGEQNKWAAPGGLKETIDNKYLGIAGANRAARVPPPTPPATPDQPATSPASNPYNPPPGTVGLMQGGGTPPPQYGTQPNGTYITDPSTQMEHSNSGGQANVYLQDSGPRKGLRYIVVNGYRRYESNNGAGDWGKGGIVKIGP
jgi:hypothetical protein